MAIFCIINFRPIVKITKLETNLNASVYCKNNLNSTSGFAENHIIVDLLNGRLYFFVSITCISNYCVEEYLLAEPCY